MPAALNAGCSYELFWHLNPRKLEIFFRAERDRRKQEAEQIDNSAWLYGAYVQQAISACFSKHSNYPSSPRGIVDDDENEKHPAKKMTDADNFALFMAKHNKAIKEKNMMTE